MQRKRSKFSVAPSPVMRKWLKLLSVQTLEAAVGPERGEEFSVPDCGRA